MDRREIRQHLEGHLRFLSVDLGERSIFRPANLKAAEDYVLQRFAAMGYSPRRQTFIYMREPVSNIIAGEETPSGYYLLGAHYDTVAGTPGADDNAAGPPDPGHALFGNGGILLPDPRQPVAPPASAAHGLPHHRQLHRVGE